MSSVALLAALDTFLGTVKQVVCEIQPRKDSTVRLTRQNLPKGKLLVRLNKDFHELSLAVHASGSSPYSKQRKKL
jgi:hypothetical protein